MEHERVEDDSSVGESSVPEAVPARGRRREFVEPEVSFPVDVLESTTFFQFTESGATN